MTPPEESQMQLTPARLFANPPLAGTTPSAFKFSPDADCLFFRRAAADDRQRFDLWKVDASSGEKSLYIDARSLLHTSTDITDLTDAERAERERKRQFSHGITDYFWRSNHHQLIVIIDGQAFLIDTQREDSQSQQLCPAGSRQSGFQCSPRGSYLSYVRSNNLYICDFAGNETRLTTDEDPLLCNGLPDFLAAEEMHRFEGHWWSQDETYLVYCKVDESPVKPSFRMEVDATGARTIEQRYPHAGEPNPSVELWHVDLTTSTHKRIWQSDDQTEYLARVLCSHGEIIIQTQDRRQQRLDIMRYAESAESWQLIHQQHSDTWINLTDDLRFIDDGCILYSSEQEGTRKLYTLTFDAKQSTTQALTGPQHINRVLHASNKCAYAMGWDTDASQNHLYKLDFVESRYEQITASVGWHEVIICATHNLYLDRVSNATQPEEISLHCLSHDKTTQQIFTENIDKDHPYAPYLHNHVTSIYGQFPAQDGQVLYYRLTPPSHIEGQHATLVYVYGGPGVQKVRREWSPLMVQLFAQNGFGVLEIDNRGSSNRGSQFEAPLYKAMGSIEVVDQVAGLSILTDHAWADLSRVGIYGHSYGGYMSLMCLTQAPQAFKAGVAVAPVSDWALYDSHYTERYMGLPDENVSAYHNANVLSHLDKLSQPLLLMHGMADDNVLFTHSTMIMSKLQHLGKPFELMTYPFHARNRNIDSPFRHDPRLF